MKYFICFIALLFCAAKIGKAQTVAGQPCPELPTKAVMEGETIKLEPHSPTLGPNPVDPPIFSGTLDRIVYWVHGLGGGPSAWAKPADVTAAGGTVGYPARKVRSFRPSYSEGSTVAAGGATLLMAIGGINGPLQESETVQAASQSFIIAHSQGGLVSRSAGDLNLGNPTLFGGIVTFGTPHAGALISNNLAAATTYFNGFCLDILAGPTGGFLLPTNDLGATADFICNLVSGTFMGSFGMPILMDYPVGGAGVTGLGEGNVEHKVVFAGVENEEVVWRELWHIINKSADYPVFEATDQQKGQNAADKLKSFYWTIGNFYYPWNKKIANNWYKGHYAWANGNINWKTLIGGLAFVPGTIPACSCTTYNANGVAQGPAYVNPGPCSNTWSPGPQPGWYQICTATTMVSIDAISTPNDGVVPEPSQIAYPGRIIGFPMVGSNHQSERNDQNTKASLLSIFRGSDDFWFYTEER